MLEDGSAQCEDCPGWNEIVLKLVLTVVGFVMALTFFSITSSDIRGYFEDHNMGFEGINDTAIVLLMVVFLVLPRIILDIYNRYFPQKRRNDSRMFYVIGLIFSVLTIIFIMSYVFPLVAPGEGEERDALWTLVLEWLIFIIVINILFDSAVFQVFQKIFQPNIAIFKRIRGFIKSETNEGVPNEK